MPRLNQANRDLYRSEAFQRLSFPAQKIYSWAQRFADNDFRIEWDAARFRNAEWLGSRHTTPVKVVSGFMQEIVDAGLVEISKIGKRVIAQFPVLAIWASEA